MLSLIVYVVILGLLYYVITLLPLPDPFPLVVKILFVVLLILILLNAVGYVSFPAPHLR